MCLKRLLTVTPMTSRIGNGPMRPKRSQPSLLVRHGQTTDGKDDRWGEKVTGDSLERRPWNILIPGWGETPTHLWGCGKPSPQHLIWRKQKTRRKDCHQGSLSAPYLEAQGQISVTYSRTGKFSSHSVDGDGFIQDGYPHLPLGHVVCARPLLPLMYRDFFPLYE